VGWHYVPVQYTVNPKSLSQTDVTNLQRKDGKRRERGREKKKKKKINNIRLHNTTQQQPPPNTHNKH
jgi:hypothetical protein